MEEMWPSPVARRLMMKRRQPSGTPDWSGWGTIDGLNKAADSKRILAGKQGPDEQLALARKRALGDDVWLDFLVVVEQQDFDVEVAGVESGPQRLEFGGDLLFR